MSKFRELKKIFINYGFTLVDTDSEANIIIKSPSIIFKDETGKEFEKYQIIRAAHKCKTQIRLITMTLLRLFGEHEDIDFINTFGCDDFEGELGENKFWVQG